MAGFDQEANRILDSEKKDAARDAKDNAVSAQIVLAAACVLFVAFMAAQSVITGEHFSWSVVAFVCGGYAAGAVGKLINDHFKAFRKRRDARMIRIELKLDRLLELNKELPGKELKKAEEKEETDEELLAKYRASAERGEQWGQHNLGITYNNNKDYAQAAIWYRKAAEQGDVAAQFYLAQLLARGVAADADYAQADADHAEALRLYRMVAESGHTYSTMAEYDLGEMYAGGWQWRSRDNPEVVQYSRNYPEAVKYWTSAAQHGYPLASSCLGDLYKRGAVDFQQNFEQAYFWYYVAVGAENPKKVSKYWIENRDDLARRLDLECRQGVQERARLWLSGKWDEAYQSSGANCDGARRAQVRLPLPP